MSLLMTAALLIGYSLLIKAGAVPDGRGMSQEQQNIARLERFLFEEDSRPNVLVGSSLAYNIKVERLDPGFENLGLAAGSSLTGMAVILASEKKPRRVFVEISEHIGRGDDAPLIADLTSPWRSSLRRHFPALQQRFQPVNVGVGAIRRSMAEAPSAQVDAATRRVLVEHRLRRADVPVDEEERGRYVDALARIEARASLLASRGSQVIFVHVPVEPVLEKTARHRELADLARTRLSHPHHRWMPQPERDAWTTTDGVHLAPPDAEAFARALIGYAAADDVPSRVASR